MATIFDRDTLLDLTVNAIPLGIILFFVAVFLALDPWGGMDTLGKVLQMGLLAFPFVALAILTYVSGKAVAGDEHRAKVFFQGQATLEDAPTKEEAEAETHVADEAEEAADGDDADDEEKDAAADADDEDDEE
ncbi:DUF6684 family protein [Halobaculum sp. D14]|uniref:DUF6684 family protein n=1 Tax=Halobaculum sp. D14 TaxID=3421642 RepID=UPI003EBCA08B